MSAYWCMPYHVFSGADDNEPFKAWLRAHRKGGYYLNVLTSTKGKIHAVACDHVWDKKFKTKKNLTRKAKVASSSVQELRTYAEERGIKVKACHRKICP